ncbi:MAG TPA: hypothetical protein V6D18_08895 [Thermosynechococcaceae cyanobacterium]
MIIFEELLLVGVVLLAGVLVAQTVQRQQQQRRLQDAFYRSLELDNGCLSLIQLALRARVEAAIAKEFLEAQAQAFSATLETDAEGETFYRFPKLRLHSRGQNG